MDRISSYMGDKRSKELPAGRRGKAQERGDLMQYFMQKLNVGRTRDGLGPLTMGRMGRLLVAIPTKDLYFLKSICDDAQKRGDINSFSKKFWWEVSPKNHTPEAKKKQAAAAKTFSAVQLPQGTGPKKYLKKFKLKKYDA